MDSIPFFEVLLAPARWGVVNDSLVITVDSGLPSGGYLHTAGIFNTVTKRYATTFRRSKTNLEPAEYFVQTKSKEDVAAFLAGCIGDAQYYTEGYREQASIDIYQFLLKLVS